MRGFIISSGPPSPLSSSERDGSNRKGSPLGSSRSHSGGPKQKGCEITIDDGNEEECFSCKEMMKGPIQVVQFGSLCFHVDHFQCQSCSSPLKPNHFHPVLSLDGIQHPRCNTCGSK